MITDAIKIAIEGKEIQAEMAEDAMQEIMSGTASPVQIAALLTALRMKGETPAEIAAFAKVMRAHCERISPRVKGTLVDTCGTGGDSVKTFNVSTAAAFVAAGAGVAVAKHGNRSITSKCGSADVLEALGVNLNLTPIQVEGAIEKVGIGFMFSPKFHPAMKHALPVRKELGIRTVFNLLGPLTNPANAGAQLVGVYSKELVGKTCEALKRLGVERCIVVHGSGMDEISTLGSTNVAELNDGEIREYVVSPEDFGIQRAAVEDLQAPDVQASCEFLREVLGGKKGPRRDIVVLNAGAAIYAGSLAKTIAEGIGLAEDAIDSGHALKKLDQLINFGVE